MDKIIAKGLRFKGCHGVLESEKRTAQEFIVDLILYRDLEQAGRNDDLNDTVSYDTVFHVVEDIVEKESFNLIEALAETIAERLLDTFAIAAAEVTVYKPNAPVIGDFEYFAVNIKRTRKNNL